VSDGVTVDANIMKMFSHDFLAERDSESRQLIEKALHRHGLVIDIGGKIQHEWLATCGGLFFKEWFIQQMKLGLIRQVKPKIEVQHKKKLVIGHGMPTDGYDLVYVAVSNVTVTRYIVTEDIDFFDPALKLADRNTKDKAKEKRNGPICKYLRNAMGIRVGLPTHAIAELFDEGEEA
jgi:hypothetical protein